MAFGKLSRIILFFVNNRHVKIAVVIEIFRVEIKHFNKLA